MDRSCKTINQAHINSGYKEKVYGLITKNEQQSVESQWIVAAKQSIQQI